MADSALMKQGLEGLFNPKNQFESEAEAYGADSSFNEDDGDASAYGSGVPYMWSRTFVRTFW